MSAQLQVGESLGDKYELNRRESVGSDGLI